MTINRIYVGEIARALVLRDQMVNRRAVAATARPLATASRPDSARRLLAWVRSLTR